MRKIFILVLITAFILGISSCKKQKENVENAVENVGEELDTLADKAISKLDEFGNFIWSVGDTVDLAVNDSLTLKVGNKSTEYLLFDRLKGDYEVKETVSAEDWIHFTNVNFETGGANVAEGSKRQLDNVIAILNAFPNAALKIGGYTDNTGAADANKAISQQRADAVMAYFTAAGIGADRLKAEGFGPEFPVCDTDESPECLAQNRRVDLRITQK